jgi:hypothetical protein
MIFLNTALFDGLLPDVLVTLHAPGKVKRILLAATL